MKLVAFITLGVTVEDFPGLMAQATDRWPTDAILFPITLKIGVV